MADSQGRTALIHACEKRCNDIVRILIHHHNVKPDVEDCLGTLVTCCLFVSMYLCCPLSSYLLSICCLATALLPFLCDLLGTFDWHPYLSPTCYLHVSSTCHLRGTYLLIACPIFSQLKHWSWTKECSERSTWRQPFSQVNPCSCKVYPILLLLHEDGATLQTAMFASNRNTSHVGQRIVCYRLNMLIGGVNETFFLTRAQYFSCKRFFRGHLRDALPPAACRYMLHILHSKMGARRGACSS